MTRRGWFGYQPAAVEHARQAAQAAFEEDLAQLHSDEIALRERLLHLRAHEEGLTLALSQLEVTEEALRGALTHAIDRESAQLQTVGETYAHEVAEQRARIADLLEERERLARVEAALIATVRSALAEHSRQEVQQR